GVSLGCRVAGEGTGKVNSGGVRLNRALNNNNNNKNNNNNNNNNKNNNKQQQCWKSESTDPRSSSCDWGQGGNEVEKYVAHFIDLARIGLVRRQSRIIVEGRGMRTNRETDVVISKIRGNKRPETIEWLPRIHDHMRDQTLSVSIATCITQENMQSVTCASRRVTFLGTARGENEILGGNRHAMNVEVLITA
nr:hypothetical protein [Tanacetum cinerariifolium]